VKGYPGVSVDNIRYRAKRKGRAVIYTYYKARISIGGRVIQLGHFSTPEAAAAAYRKAKIKYRTASTLKRCPVVATKPTRKRHVPSKRSKPAETRSK
jgi:hypothetical protein